MAETGWTSAWTEKRSSTVSPDAATPGPELGRTHDCSCRRSPGATPRPIAPWSSARRSRRAPRAQVDRCIHRSQQRCSRERSADGEERRAGLLAALIDLNRALASKPPRQAPRGLRSTLPVVDAAGWRARPGGRGPRQPPEPAGWSGCSSCAVRRRCDASSGDEKPRGPTLTRQERYDHGSMKACSCLPIRRIDRWPAAAETCHESPMVAS